MQRAGSRVKVHYIGYDDSSDEWHELGDIVTTNRRDPTNTRNSITQVQLYSLYKELGIKIKQALVYGRKQSPVVKITMAFDYLLFKGGLQTAGTPARCVQGYQWYKIECYSNLDFLLGTNCIIMELMNMATIVMLYWTVLNFIFLSDQSSLSIIHHKL